MLRVSLSALLFSPLLCLAQTPPAAIPAPEAAPANPPSSVTVLPAAQAAKVTYSQCRVDGPFIAMTFDDGPHAENTPRLLNMLKKRGVKATFFVVGQCVVEYPAIMKRIVAEGHEIASHSWSHPLLTKLGEGAVTDQLQRTHDAILRTTGVEPKVMRPPYGGFTATQRGWAHRKWGYKCILWDVDPLDWKYRSAQRVEAEILKQTVPGSIVLAHDIHKSTVDAMPPTLDALAAKGFKFVTVSELLAMDRPPAPKVRATPAPVPAALPASAPEAAPTASARE